MGCQAIKPSDTLLDKLNSFIEQNDHAGLLLLYQKNLNINKQEIESISVSIKSLKLNTLAYSIFLGRFECFKILIETYLCSIERCNTLLLSQNTSIISLLCEKGYRDIFKYVMKNDELLLKKFKMNSNDINTLTPIQIAVEKGNLGIVQEIFSMFGNNPPQIFDWNLQDCNTGENCALIACRKCNFIMIQYIFEYLNGNFYVKNKLGENALQVLSAGSGKTNKKYFFDTFVYLVEVVGIDLLDEYEEVLLLMDNCDAVKYFERKLRELGVFVSKEEVEDKFKVNMDLERCTWPREESLDEDQKHDFSQY